VERARVQLAEEESDSCRGLEQVETWTSKRLYKAAVLCICDRDFEAGTTSAPHCMILGQSPTCGPPFLQEEGVKVDAL